MPTVPDLSTGQGATDRPLSKPNRSNSGTPVGVLTPLYSGEVVLDTTTNQEYVGSGSTNLGWTPVFLAV